MHLVFCIKRTRPNQCFRNFRKFAVSKVSSPVSLALASNDKFLQLSPIQSTRHTVTDHKKLPLSLTFVGVTDTLPTILPSPSIHYFCEKPRSLRCSYDFLKNRNEEKIRFHGRRVNCFINKTPFRKPQDTGP
jgi:hypothetical protein